MNQMTVQRIINKLELLLWEAQEERSDPLRFGPNLVDAVDHRCTVLAEILEWIEETIIEEGEQE